MTGTLAEAMSAGPIVLDGGLSTHLETMGYDLSGSALWSARLITDEPDAIVAAHADFYAAGAQVATSATYQASLEGFEAAGMDRFAAAKMMRLGVRLAIRARDEALGQRSWSAADQAATYPDATGNDAAATRATATYASAQQSQGRWVAASVGPYGAMLANGSEYRGDYGLSVRELREWHRPRLAILAEAGADVLAVETIPCAAEVEAIIAELAGSGMSAWISVSARMHDGVPCTAAGEPLVDVFAMARGVDEIIAVGVNCCDPSPVAEMIDAATKSAGKPGVVYPNRGETWDAAAKTWIGAGRFDPGLVRNWLDAGAMLIGGCCRVEPDAIAAIRTQLT